MKPIPFRLRIALFSALISGVVLLAFGGASWYWIGRQKLESMDTEIRSLGARHPGWFANRGSYERLDSALESIFGAEHRQQVILLAKDAAGETLYTSSGWPADIDPDRLDCALEDAPSALDLPHISSRGDPGEKSPAPGVGRGRERGGRGWGLGFGRGGPPAVGFTKVPRFQTVRTVDTIWRLGILGTADTTVVIGLNYAAAQEALDRMRNLFLVTLCAALLLIGMGGWLVAGRALRPLHGIARTAEQVTAMGLDQRIPASREDPEIARLIEVLNRMMDRLEASFHQASRFSADASHELKTPLAVMQGELENALQTASPGSPEQQVFATLLEETQRLKGITRSLLLLAQADAGQLPLAAERTDLRAALQELLEDVEVMAAPMRLRIEVDASAPAWVAADWSLLRQAVLNLLHNAVRYNEPDGWMRIALRAQDDGVELEVCNGGPGVPQADQSRIFDRFFRPDGARSRQVDGVGLGLSLAREIVRAHRGTLTLRESRPGRTCFLLALPRA